MAEDNPNTTLTDERVISLQRESQEFVFEKVAVVPVPSLLRNFSAPVVLEFDYSEAELAHLLAHDADPFNRWEAGQRLASQIIIAATADITAGKTPVWSTQFASAAARILSDAASDPAFAAEALTLPGEATLAEQLEVVDPDALHAARYGLRRFLAEQLGAQFRSCYEQLTSNEEYRPDAIDAGRRALRNLCLGYLSELGSAESRALAKKQFDSANNMTDQFASLSVLAQCEGEERGLALEAFYRRWKDEALVIDKWLQVQSTSRRAETLAEVMRLVDHPAFDIRNPNKVYALLRAFGSNHVRFNAADGSGYRFIAEQTCKLDGINPQVASRLARSFDRWRKFDSVRQQHARTALETIRNHEGLSRDVYEVVEKSLG